jgi:hypothetical protein
MTIACLLIASSAHAGWLYLVPGYDWFGYRDPSGVLHAWQAEKARYDQSSKVYQVKIHGRWLTVEEDVFKLSQ